VNYSSRIKPTTTVPPVSKINMNDLTRRRHPTTTSLAARWASTFGLRIILHARSTRTRVEEPNTPQAVIAFITNTRTKREQSRFTSRTTRNDTVQSTLSCTLYTFLVQLDTPAVLNGGERPFLMKYGLP